MNWTAEFDALREEWWRTFFPSVEEVRAPNLGAALERQQKRQDIEARQKELMAIAEAELLENFVNERQVQ
jgi:hypothetical protein